MSTFGKLFRVTTYGESHCASVGAIIDGCPPVGQNRRFILRALMVSRGWNSLCLIYSLNSADEDQDKAILLHSECLKVCAAITIKASEQTERRKGSSATPVWY